MLKLLFFHKSSTVLILSSIFSPRSVFAVMGAMIYIVIRNKGWLGDLSARQILIMAAFSLYFGFTSTGVDNTTHIGGLVSGLLLAVILYHPGRKI